MLDFIIPAGCFAVIIAAIGLSRYRDAAARSAVAREYGWEAQTRREPYWREALRDVSLMRIGHSRRFGSAFRTPEGAYVMSYICETGFEHRRETHRWRLIVREVDHNCGRAAVTAKAWLLASTASPVAWRIPLQSRPTSDEASAEWTAVTEDTDEWESRFESGLGDWFTSQPESRSWEILPHLVVGYEPGGMESDKLRDLAASTDDLVSRLMKSPAAAEPVNA